MADGALRGGAVKTALPDCHSEPQRGEESLGRFPGGTCFMTWPMHWVVLPAHQKTPKEFMISYPGIR